MEHIDKIVKLINENPSNKMLGAAIRNWYNIYKNKLTETSTKKASTSEGKGYKWENQKIQQD